MREANAQEAKPSVCDVKASFNEEGMGDRYCALTKKSIMNNYEIVRVKNDICSEPQWCKSFTWQELLGPSIKMNREMKDSRPV